MPVIFQRKGSKLLWWVNLGSLPGAHQATFLLHLLNKTVGENKIKKIMGWDKDREITHQVPSQEKQTQIQEN